MCFFLITLLNTGRLNMVVGDDGFSEVLRTGGFDMVEKRQGGLDLEIYCSFEVLLYIKGTYTLVCIV